MPTIYPFLDICELFLLASAFGPFPDVCYLNQSLSSSVESFPHVWNQFGSITVYRGLPPVMLEVCSLLLD